MTRTPMHRTARQYVAVACPTGGPRPRGGPGGLRVALVVLSLPGMANIGYANAPASRPVLTVPLRVVVADCPGDDPSATSPSPVRPAAWVRAHIDAAKRVLQPYGIALRETIDRFSPQRCDLKSRGARHGLARHVRMDGVATVLVVRRIRDLDVPTYNLMGVHWRYRGKDATLRGRRWVFITARARPPVLAHELCHYFGLRHDPKGGNLMTPGPSSPLRRRKGANKPAPFAPILTPAQVHTLRANVARFLEHKG